MFCKWCGQAVDETKGRCGACGRELPPLSECGGFYHIMPEAKLAQVRKPVEEPIPRQPAPAAPAAPGPAAFRDVPPQPPASMGAAGGRERNRLVPVLAAALGLAMLAFLITLVIAISSGSKLRQLENRNGRDDREVIETGTEPTDPDATDPAQTPEQQDIFDRDALSKLLQEGSPVFSCSTLPGGESVVCGEETLRNVYDTPVISEDGESFPNFEKKGVPADKGVSVYVVNWVMTETYRELFKAEGHLSALLYTRKTDDGWELCAVDLDLDEDAFGPRSKDIDRRFCWEYCRPGTDQWVEFTPEENSVRVENDGAKVIVSSKYIDKLRQEDAPPALRCVLTRPNTHSDGKHGSETGLRLVISDIPLDVVFN